MKLSEGRTPWQRIRDAGKKGTGLRLTDHEVSRLCMDDAIITRALLDDENQKGIADKDAWGRGVKGE